MANDKDLARLRQGAAVWNAWRGQNRESPVDLGGANLGGANLGGANLGAVDLGRANLGRADLSRTNLIRTNLGRADLGGANLGGANLGGANLGGANLGGANLDGADLGGAFLVETVLANVNLSTTTGLDSCIHHGPSIIDHRTLQWSGRLPLAFRRGCGLPDLPSPPDEAIKQYSSCFISYSSKDDVFANRLYGDLQNNGVRCWFAPEDMQTGDKFRQRIDEAIHVHERLLLILSENSVSSEWVEKEVETALEKERRQKRTVLFPVRLDDAVKKCHTGWSADIRRTRHIGDFCQWKNHDSYQRAFSRVLRDLKAAPG